MEKNGEQRGWKIKSGDEDDEEDDCFNPEENQVAERTKYIVQAE